MPELAPGVAACRATFIANLPAVYAWCSTLNEILAVNLAVYAQHGLAAGFEHFAEVDEFVSINAVLAARTFTLERVRELGRRAAMLEALDNFGEGGNVIPGIISPFSDHCPPLQIHLRISIDDAGGLELLRRAYH